MKSTKQQNDQKDGGGGGGPGGSSSYQSAQNSSIGQGSLANGKTGAGGALSQRAPNDPAINRQDSGVTRQVSGGNLNKNPDSAGSGTRGLQQTQAHLKPPLDKKIQMNTGINGIKGPQQAGDRPQITQKGTSGGQNQNTAQIRVSPMSPAGAEQDSSFYNDLNASGQQLLGATQNVDYEGFLPPDSPQKPGSFLRPNIKQHAQNIDNAPTVRGSQLLQNAGKQTSFAPTAASGSNLTAIVNGMKGAGGLLQPRVKPLNLGRVTPGQSLDLDGLDNYMFDGEGTPQNLFKQKGRNVSHLSVRSSFDYLDVNLNQGMDLVSKSRLQRSSQLLHKKTYKEDHDIFSGDESVHEKQMKMPNINLNEVDYQREIGVNLHPGKELTTILHHSEVQEDTFAEAKDMIPSPNFYKIVRKDRIQIINDYHDRCPFLELRKQIMRARVYINRGAQLVMMHSLFESISISVIIVNSLFLAMDDPLRDASETPAFMLLADDIFQYLYTVEMVVKILSLGFILNNGSYLRDAWNILDFVIIGSGYLGMFLQGSGVNLSVLRSFRVIRPLRTISSVQGLRIIVSSLINAVPLLRDSILVLFFFFLIFAIAGCQLFTGALKMRCFNEETGIIDPRVEYCGGSEGCFPSFYCAKSNENPSNGATNFDNVMFSMMQVFQIVTREGWTAIMVPLLQSVGSWIFIYFYPIIFVGSFFLLNLTLAVIKAKFTEEMASKKESSQPKKKKLADAPSSSENEDLQAELLKDELENIRESKNMSPRSKENIIKKIKIEHLIQKIDKTLEKRDIEHRIVEYADFDEETEKASQKQSKRQKSKKNRSSNVSLSKNKMLDAVAKISILKPAASAFSVVKSVSVPSKTKVHPNVNYSQVFHNGVGNKQSFLDAPRANKGIMKHIANSLSRPKILVEAPIKEDEEEQNDQAALLAGDDARDFIRKNNKKQGASAKEMMSMTMPHNKAVQPGVNNWLGRAFAVGKNGDEDAPRSMRALIFAGMTSTNKRNGMGQAHNTARSPFKGRPPLHQANQDNESMKRAVYENITKNFDIFEFLEKENNTMQSKKGTTKHDIEYGDDEMSDELEFEIDENDLYMDSEGRRINRIDNSATIADPILDLDDDSSDGGAHSNTNNNSSNMDPYQLKLKRGSTQATVAENGKNGKQTTSEQSDTKYVSPFNAGNQSLSKQPSATSIRDANKSLSKSIKKSQIDDLIYKGNEKGIMKLFRACKKIKARTLGTSFKEEYLLIKKRPKSQERPADVIPDQLDLDTHAGGGMAGNKLYQHYLETRKEYNTDKNAPKHTERAKSIDTKRKKILREAEVFISRLNVMRRRRAQFFAPAIKKIGVKRKDLDQQYEDYVFQKRKIHVDPELMEEKFIKKSILYRSPSCEAIMRQSEYLNRDPLALGQKHRKRGYHPYEVEQLLRANDQGDLKLELESVRSEILEKEYRIAVDNHNRKKIEIKRHRHHEYIPNMEMILSKKELKIVCKMTNMKFQSISDIFEKSGPGRFMTDREKMILAQEEKRKEALISKLPKRIPTKPMILGYQKKIFIEEKQFHEELLRNEFYPSDEDQAGMINRIEDEYNYDHRSHIFVTGTISVCVAKPHADNKILNASYHANLKEIEMEQKLSIESQACYYQQKGENPLDLLLVEESKKHKKEGTQVIFDKDNFKGKPSMFKSLKISQNLSQQMESVMKIARSTSKFIFSTKKAMSMNESDVETATKIPPKPEPLTDNQIVNRLNLEVQNSMVFKGINIRKFPAEIVRRKELDKNLFKKRKKKETTKQQEEAYIASDDSQIEYREARKARKVDYFVDRPIDGYFHIKKAREVAFQRPKDTREWSGQDIMARYDPYKARLAVSKLDTIRVWPYSVHGVIKKARVLLRQFMNGPLIEHGMTLCVLGNTVVLSLDYYGASQAIQDGCALANTAFTLIFASEMGLRIIAIGPYKYQADRMNYMDGTIVILSLVELIFMSGSGALSALRAVRIFRVFRVLRVARLLRGLKSMLQIINVISRSISSFIYLAMLLMLFIFIYALLGMQMFGGTFRDEEVVGTVRYNFDSFNNAFITSFILLTTENWNSVMFFAFSGDTSQAIIAVYFVSCIFIGNWMLLNLFLAILLDSFTQVEEEDMMTPEKKEAIKSMMLSDLKYKEGEDFIEGMNELQKEGFALKNDAPKKKKKKKKGSKGKPAPVPQNNILKESQEIDLEEVNKRTQQLLEERKQLFRGIEAENSCYIFSKRNWIRIFCYKVINHGQFENFVMILIVFSSFKLVFDTYTNNMTAEDPVVIYSSYFDLAFQILFTIEMCLKIIAFGFVMDENSYLTEGWSQLDCFIVVTGLIDTSFEGVDIPVIKVLRLLRILRPLRFVSHSSSMKTLIEALVSSLGSIFNVGVVIVIVFMMFAILGVNLFAGKLQYCTVDFYKINNQEECFKARGQWETFLQNMDNVMSGMLTLFIVSNNEGWPDVMYAYGDATGVETGPKPGASILNNYFFVFFVFVGSFFFLNLFVGVLFLSFEKAQRDEKDAMLLDGNEVKWVDMMKMILQEKPEIIKIPKNFIRHICYKIVDDESPFANFIMACIIFNIFTMAATFEGQSDAYSFVLEQINYVFTGAFAIECFLKLIAHGGNYFSSSWNKFDFFVVSASFLDIVMANMSANSLKVIRVGPQLARIMRVMRVSRLFKLLNKYKGLQALIQTITFSMPSVINAFALLALVYFIFSVLGVFFFKDITSGSQIDDYMNFTNFTMSLMMMLRLSTGEDWPVVMFDCMNTNEDCIPGENCGTGWAPVFYLIFVIIQQYIMVNLFILIILQQFDLYYLPDDNVLDRFKADVTNFKIVWKRCSADFDGYKIRGDDLKKFMMELKGDLGMSNMKNDKKGIERDLIIMNLQADEDGFVYFNELLYKIMKRRYMPGRTKKKILFECELQTLEKLEKINKDQIFQSRKKERQNATAVNPFMSMMYKNMSFSVWYQMYLKNLPLRKYHMELGLERQISDVDEEEENVEVAQGDQFEYVTDEEEEVDEYDTGYIEMIEQQNRDIEAAAEAAAKLDLHGGTEHQTPAQ